MVALEAWALGKPVLANGRCDVLQGPVHPQQRRALLRELHRVLETLRAIDFDPSLAAALGRNGREYFAATTPGRSSSASISTCSSGSKRETAGGGDGAAARMVRAPPQGRCRRRTRSSPSCRQGRRSMADRASRARPAVDAAGREPRRRRSRRASRRQREPSARRSHRRREPTRAPAGDRRRAARPQGASPSAASNRSGRGGERSAGRRRPPRRPARRHDSSHGRTPPRRQASVPAVHQVLATLGYGDAIGHEVLGIQRVLRERRLRVGDLRRDRRSAARASHRRLPRAARRESSRQHPDPPLLDRIAGVAHRLRAARSDGARLPQHHAARVLRRRASAARAALLPRPPRARASTRRAAISRSATPNTTARSSRRPGFPRDRRAAGGSRTSRTWPARQLHAGAARSTTTGSTCCLSAG